MKLETQVIVLELAKRLKELGVKQESLFQWVHHDNGYHPSDPEHAKEWYVHDRSWIANQHDLALRKVSEHILDEDCISAFTVAELGEMLPKIINLESAELGIDFYKNQWRIRYLVCDGGYDGALTQVLKLILLSLPTPKPTPVAQCSCIS